MELSLDELMTSLCYVWNTACLSCPWSRRVSCQILTASRAQARSYLVELCGWSQFAALPVLQSAVLSCADRGGTVRGWAAPADWPGLPAIKGMLWRELTSKGVFIKLILRHVSHTDMSKLLAEISQACVLFSLATCKIHVVDRGQSISLRCRRKLLQQHLHLPSACKLGHQVGTNGMKQQSLDISPVGTLEQVLKPCCAICRHHMGQTCPPGGSSRGST